MDLSTLAIAAGLTGWVAPPVKPVPSAPTKAADAPLVAVAGPSGETLRWEAMIGGLDGARLVYAGEKHDELSHHELQGRLLAALAERDEAMAVGLEMATPDDDATLARFVSGDMGEPEFAEWWKKTWGYDYAFYKPVFDAARAKKLAVRGLNAPRALIKAVARRGLSGLTPEERAQLPASIEESADPRYRKFVHDSLTGHGTVPPEVLARMTQAMAVWNEFMGERAARLSAESRLFVVAGHGHMLWRAGVPESAIRRGAGASAVVLPYPTDGELLPVPEALRRLRDPRRGELALADRFVLFP